MTARRPRWRPGERVTARRGENLTGRATPSRLHIPVHAGGAGVNFLGPLPLSANRRQLCDEPDWRPMAARSVARAARWMPSWPASDVQFVAWASLGREALKILLAVTQREMWCSSNKSPSTNSFFVCRLFCSQPPGHQSHCSSTTL